MSDLFKRALPLALALSLVPALPAASADPVAAPYRAASPGLMNPDLSLDGLFSLTQFSRSEPLSFDDGHDPHHSGFNIQQVELTYGGNVDPYLRADANLVVIPAGIEIEEAYLTTLALPGNFQLKAGQFLNAFGRQNPTHPHAWDFADKPLVSGRFFGGDGLRNPGLQAGWLTPLPWFAELTASMQQATGATAASFQPAQTRSLADLVYLLKLTHFVPLNEAWSLSLGQSYLNGANAAGARTHVVGGDLYLRMRPTDSLAFVALQVEAIGRFYGPGGGAASLNDWGAYAQLTARLPGAWQRWHVGLRGDYLGAKAAPVQTATLAGADGDLGRRYRISPVVTFYPSEFSKVRLQYGFDRPLDWDAPQHVASLQWEFLIGSHGAHKF